MTPASASTSVPARQTSRRFSAIWFALVGASAALTHMLAFASFKNHWIPEAANAAGFVIAFFVSFAGHRWLSFRGADTSVAQSLGRFAATALGGFLTNEIVFTLLLRGLGWSAWAALLVGLVTAAGQTYVLSRWWAFRRG